MITRLILVHHGETGWSAERRWQGITDVPLSAYGREQAQALACRLAGEEIGSVYSSDLARAWETATLVAAPHSTRPRPEPRLREVAFGRWEGLTEAQVRQRYPEEYARWQTDPMSTAPDGGETLAQVATRMGCLHDDLVARHRGETVLLVAHGMALRVLVCVTLGLDPCVRLRFRMDVASVSEIALSPEGAALTLFNDRHHLAREGHLQIRPHAPRAP